MPRARRQISIVGDFEAIVEWLIVADKRQSIRRLDLAGASLTAAKS
jgi:hypothetical protein